MSGLFGSSTASGKVDPEQAPFLQYLREQAQGQYEQYGGTQAQAGFDLADRLTDRGEGFLDTLGAGSNQQVADSQIESLTDILNRNLSMNLGMIGGNASVGNTFGGGRQGVMEGTAIGDTQLALASGVSDIYANQNQMNLMGASTGLGALKGQFGLGMSGFFNQQQPLGNFSNMIGKPTVLGGGGSGGDMADIASTAADIYAMYLASDERLKKDIVPIGEHKGYKWYEYSYKWEDIRRIGVMAQEVLKIKPEAVIEHPDGYLMVNYGGL